MKIQTKISSAIFVLIIVTGIVATTTSYIISKQMIKYEIYHHLENIVTSRTHHIETLLNKEVKRAKTFATDKVFVNIFTTQNLTHAVQKIKTLINIYDDISQIRVLDKQGNVLVSSHSKFDHIGNAETFAYDKEGAYIRDMHISTMTGTKVISISVPILVKGEFAGIVIVNVKIEEELYEILLRRQKKTDEVYLINKDGYMITPSRFMEDTFLKLQVNSSETRKCFELSKEEPETEHHKIDIYEDYRGELVIGMHRAIKGMNWCLLAKIDTKDAFAPVNKLVRLMALFFMLLLGVSSLLAFFIAKNITRPIAKLHRRSEEIEKGNWDYQITVDTQDEIGQFSNAFDSMTTRLKKAQDELQCYQNKLEIQVAERTTELSQRIQEIEQQKVLRKNVERIIQHDLKSPLNGIITLSEFLAEEPDLNPDYQKKVLGHINSSGHHMLNMINRFSDLYKMETGQYCCHSVLVDIVDIIERIIIDSERETKSNNLCADVIYCGKPITKADTFIVLGEDSLCYSMLANLFQNAVEASPEGEHITVTLNEEDAQIISIHNKGAVPKEIRDKFFDKYTTANKTNGTGLGSYSAKLMVETQGGTIHLETSEEMGTTVTIRLLGKDKKIIKQ